MIDPVSASWTAVRKHVEKEIEQAREQLEQPGPIEQAQYQRGRIHALRGILKLSDKPAPVVEDAVLY